jgi:hypothetical protein
MSRNPETRSISSNQEILDPISYSRRRILLAETDTPSSDLHLRRPQVQGLWYSCDEDKWESCSRERRRKYTHIGRIEEGDGQVVSPCNFCSSKGHICKKYKDGIWSRLNAGKPQTGQSCSRCRFSGRSCNTTSSTPKQTLMAQLKQAMDRIKILSEIARVRDEELARKEEEIEELRREVRSREWKFRNHVVG